MKLPLPHHQAAAHHLRSGSWISAFKMLPAFLVSRVMLQCFPLLCAPHCPPEMRPTPAMVRLNRLWLHRLLNRSWGCPVSCENGTKALIVKHMRAEPKLLWKP